MGKTTKIVLSDRQEAWLRRHFRNTRNADCCERLGISESALHRFARMWGLTKTGRFMKKTQLEASRAAKESHLRNGTYPPKGYIIPRSEEFRFRKGVTPVQRLGKRKEAERLRKSVETMRSIRKEERLRVMMGLPQETKLRLKVQPKRAAYQRCYLRKLGYIIPRGSKVVYYDGNTRRSLKIEGRRMGDRHYVWFDFRPLDDKKKQEDGGTTAPGGAGPETVSQI